MPAPRKHPHKPLRRHIRLQGVPGPRVLATDASLGNNHLSTGYLASTGHAGVDAHPYPRSVTGRDRTTIGELRAVFHGLRAVLHDLGTQARLEVWCDSTAALDYLRSWQQGAATMPASYSGAWRRQNGGLPTLELLQQKVAANAHRLTFAHVPGHAGVPLNEGAHYLAYLGARCITGRLEREQAEKLIKTAIPTTLHNHHTSQAEGGRR